MKTRFLTLLATLTISFIGNANQLKVSDNHTTHLLCPDVVTYVNAGNFELIHVEIIPELPTVVRIKAAGPFEGETSLTVVCRENIYSFKVTYSPTCALNLELTQFRADKLTENYGPWVPLYRVKTYADQMLLQKRNIFNRGGRQSGIAFTLIGIGIKDNLLFMQFSVTNHSNISYQMEDIQFMIRDRRSKRAANVQSYPVVPHYISDETMTIAPETSEHFVVVFKTFTIPGKREMEAALFERAGGHTGRNLSFGIRNRDILKARQL